MEETTGEILELVKKKMAEQGGYDWDAYKQFIDETMDYFFEKGKLSEEDNLELIKNRLMDMWETVKEELTEEDEPFVEELPLNEKDNF